ncbi:class I SAM-dependent methyltransferase [Macrococcus carouselicus]|nr:methionine biosynthesis protein MetW [Macrococcus carouselicus]
MDKKKERKLRKDWKKRYTFFEQPVEQVYRVGIMTGLYFKQFSRYAQSLEVQKKVLSIGCFNGALLSAIDREQPIKGYYIDQAPRNMQQAIHLYPHFSYKQLKRTHIPYKDKKFDCVYVSIPLHLFYEPEDLLAELIRTSRSFVIFDLKRYDWAPVMITAGLLPEVETERAIRYYKVSL